LLSATRAAVYLAPANAADELLGLSFGAPVSAAPPAASDGEHPRTAGLRLPVPHPWLRLAATRVRPHPRLGQPARLLKTGALPYSICGSGRRTQLSRWKKTTENPTLLPPGHANRLPCWAHLVVGVDDQTGRQDDLAVVVAAAPAVSRQQPRRGRSTHLHW